MIVEHRCNILSFFFRPEDYDSEIAYDLSSTGGFTNNFKRGTANMFR